LKSITLLIVLLEIIIRTSYKRGAIPVTITRCFVQSLAWTPNQGTTWWQWRVLIEGCNAKLVFKLTTQRASCEANIFVVTKCRFNPL